MTSAFSWQNSVSLCPASFCTWKPNFPVTPGLSWLPTFAFKSPIMKRTSFSSVITRRSCKSPENCSISASSDYLLGHIFGLLWYWMDCLANEQRSFCHFWDCIQVLHSGLFCWYEGYLQSKGLKSLLQHHPLKASVLRHSAFFIAQLSHSYMTTGKTIALTIWTFVHKVVSLHLNTLSRYVITFLPRSMRLLISWQQSLSVVILYPKKVKSGTVFIVSPSICHEVMGLDAMILVFWKLSFKPSFFKDRLLLAK